MKLVALAIAQKPLSQLTGLAAVGLGLRTLLAASSRLRRL
jgi:hypothetical protein